MVIKAKGRTFLRLLGATFILIGLIISILFSFTLLDNSFVSLMVILIIFPWFLFSIFLKLEIDFFTTNIKRILILTMIYSLILIFLTFLQEFSSGILLSFYSFTLLLLLVCWHFSLSIYKKEKVIFVISGSVYMINILSFSSQLFLLNPPIFILNIVIVCFGILSIIIIEISLRKKGFLTYI